METLAQDARRAVRSLVRTPGFAVAAVLSLAIGIGANAAIFSVTSALLLRPLPYPASDRLAILWNRSPGLGIAEDWFSTAQFFDIRDTQSGLETVAIAIGANYNLTGGGPPERVGTIRVSSNLLPMLGARAVHGRLFEPAEDAPGRPGTAILGYGTWMRRYGRDPHAIGRILILNGLPYEIVGVLPASFSLPREVMPTLGGAEDAEILLPLPLAAEAATIRNREDYNILARLKPGVRWEAAQAEMDRLTARLRAEHPDVYPANGGLTFSLVPLQEQVVGSVRTALLVLTAAVACVLLIACANVANLLLARSLARQREVAVRAALGASRARIVREVLTESVILACAGGAAGLLLALGIVRAIGVLGGESVPRLGEVAVDGGVLAFTAFVSIVSGVVFGLAPAFRLSAVDLQSALKTGSSASSATAVWSRGRSLRRVLVIAELALSVVLLIGAGLLIRSFVRLQDVSPGFTASNVLTLELTMTGPKYSDAEKLVETYRRLWQELARLPGVAAAGGISSLPLSQMMAWGPITIEGWTPPQGQSFINVDQRIAAGDYFRVMEIPLVGGRLFTPQDTRTQARVVLVDERMAEQIWPGGSALGKRLRIGGMDATANAPWLTVVGVVGRIKQDALDADSRMAIYFPHTQSVTRSMNVVVRSEADAASLTASVRGVLNGIDPDLPMFRVRTMEQRVAASLAERRFSTLLLTAFAGVALALAAIGIYSVMAYLVRQGSRELSIRLALGATPGRILALVVRHGMGVAVLGVSIGLIAALALSRLIRGLLFDVRASDPLTFAAIAVLLLGVAFTATAVPAMRASRIDPIETLKQE